LEVVAAGEQTQRQLPPVSHDPAQRPTADDLEQIIVVAFLDLRRRTEEQRSGRGAGEEAFDHQGYVTGVGIQTSRSPSASSQSLSVLTAMAPLPPT